MTKAHELVTARAAALLPFVPADRSRRMEEIRDEFLSEGDLDLRNCSEEELYAW